MAEVTFRAPDRLCLNGVIDFDSVVLLERTGLECLRQHPEVRQWVADLSGVAASNSSGLALLLSWLRAVKAAGGTMTCQHVPADFVELAGVMGAKALLGLGEFHV